MLEKCDVATTRAMNHNDLAAGGEGRLLIAENFKMKIACVF